MSGAAVRRQLRKRADEMGLEFQQALQYYAIERFLFRLSQTDLSDRLIVKGAIMLRVWAGAVARPTRDIDFLGRIDNSPDSIEAAVRECLAVQYPEDGLVFGETGGARRDGPCDASRARCRRGGAVRTHVGGRWAMVCAL